MPWLAVCLIHENTFVFLLSAGSRHHRSVVRQALYYGSAAADAVGQQLPANTQRTRGAGGEVLTARYEVWYLVIGWLSPVC